MTDVGVHIVVKGLVQGVGFRYFVAQRAQRLRVAGVVRNLPDGDVEIEAEGPHSRLEEFIREVSVGPRASRVTHVSVGWRPPRHELTEFTIQ
jgi:acylphosphatase